MNRSSSQWYSDILRFLGEWHGSWITTMYLEGFRFKSSPCRSLSVDIFLISLGTRLTRSQAPTHEPGNESRNECDSRTQVDSTVCIEQLLWACNSPICPRGFTVSKRVRYVAMQEFVSRNMPLCYRGYTIFFNLVGYNSLIPRPHPLTRRNSLVNQVEFLGLAHAFAMM